MKYPISFFPQDQAPTPTAPVMPPSPEPIPRISSTSLQDKQTFLCETLDTNKIYRYNLSNNTKTRYLSASIAKTYTPSMDITNSIWIWKNSLDGTTAKCSKIPVEGEISCSYGQTCISPSTNSVPDSNRSPSVLDSNRSPSVNSQVNPPSIQDPKIFGLSSETILILSIVGGVLACIIFLVVAGLIIYSSYKKNNKLKITKPKSGGYFYYD